VYDLSNGSVSSDLRFQGHRDAVDELCAQLTRDLFAIAKFLFTRLLTSGAKDIERVFMLKEDILSTACELLMLILSVSVTFDVTYLTVTSLITKSCHVTR